MIYLDYSATTPVNKEVLESFNKVCVDYIGNPNSLHKLGSDANELIKASTKQIANILKIKENEIIYTSGASESNNTAIKGIASKYSNRGKHIITSEFEHSSIYGPIGYLQNMGYEVSFVKANDKGVIEIDELEKLIRKDTILISITAVNSEIGILEPINEIGKFIKDNYPNIIFHSDITQLVGKKEVSLDYIDLASFSAHKFFGIKGIGGLIKKDNIELDPLIHGGKSTTMYRSGTPITPLIVAMSKALRIANDNINEKYEYVKRLNKLVRNELSKYENIEINSNEYCLPQILNLSILGVKPETMLHALESKDVFISTQTACSSSNTKSLAVYALTKSDERSRSSIRISLSYVTSMEEIEEFLSIFAEVYNSLVGVSNGNN